MEAVEVVMVEEEVAMVVEEAVGTVVVEEEDTAVVVRDPFRKSLHILPLWGTFPIMLCKGMWTPSSRT